MTDMWEMTPHSGQYYHSIATFYGNGLVDTVQLASPSVYTMAYGGLDIEGRLHTLTETTASRNIVTGVTYNPASQPTQVALTGTGPDQDDYVYDSYTGSMTKYTFQVGNTPVTMVGNLTWNANRTLNQLQITDGFNSGGTQTCNFNPTAASGTGYDDLARLVGVDCGSGQWGQTYTYNDPYDNLNQTQMSGRQGITWNSAYTASNNHCVGCTYDTDGNLTGDGNYYYGYNEFAKMKTLISSGTPSCGTSGRCLVYDAFGRIVEQSVNSTWTEVWRMQAGTVYMSGATPSFAQWPAPGGGTEVIGGSGGYFDYLHKDWLGNSRIISNSVSNVITTDQAFSPYGSIYDGFGASGSQYNIFAGTTDNFISGVTWETPNRELSQFSGRWLSPDPAGVGWNQYAYTTNPNSFIDPAGLGPGAPACFAKGPVARHYDSGCSGNYGSDPGVDTGGPVTPAAWGGSDSGGASGTFGTVGADNNGTVDPATNNYFDNLDTTQGDVTQDRDDPEPSDSVDGDDVLLQILQTFHLQMPLLAGCQGAGTPCYVVRTRSASLNIFMGKDGYFRAANIYEYYVVDQYGVAVFGAQATEFLQATDQEDTDFPTGQWTQGDTFPTNPFVDEIGEGPSISPEFTPDAFDRLQEFEVQVNGTGATYLINAVMNVGASVSGNVFNAWSVYAGRAYNP